MIVHQSVTTDTHTVSVGTSERDGHMYLVIKEGGGEGGGTCKFKLTEENKRALRTVLSPTSTWNGVLTP